MNYSLLLLANNTYFKLLHVCLKSICIACDVQKINKIYVADLGLSSEYREIIKTLNEKIEIISTNVNIENSKKIHTRGWVDAVSQKTAILLTLIKNGNTPVIMLDSDTIVIEDFVDVINPDYDIQICKRTTPFTRKDGFLVEYIASFVAINSVKGATFVAAWIKRLEERINQNMLPPHETPAMIETMQTSDIRIGLLDDKIVSCENNYFSGITKIIHAKGRDKHDSISIFRFANIKNLPYKRVINLFNDREKKMFPVIYIFKKIFNIYELKQQIKKLLKKTKG